MAVRSNPSIFYSIIGVTELLHCILLVYREKSCLEQGSTTVTTLDLIHRQEVTHGAGGAAICSLNFKMHPCLVGVNQTVSCAFISFFHLFKGESLSVFIDTAAPLPSGHLRQRENSKPPPAPTNTQQRNRLWTETWTGFGPDQIRPELHSRSGLGAV